MALELFMITMKEYKRFADQLPICDKSSTSLLDEKTYVAIQTRLMLLRKYTSKGKSNNVYVLNLIDEAKTSFPQETAFLNDIQNRFLQVNSQSFEQVLSDGTKLNLYESIEDIMYGLYLHADSNRISRLSQTNEQIYSFCTKKYVKNIELIVLELYEFFLKNFISSIIEQKQTKAPIIHLGKPDSSTQEIEKSPFWKNMFGHDATEEELHSIFKDFSAEENEIMSKSLVFLDELGKEDISIELLRKMVFWSTIDKWGDFTEAVSFYKKIPKPGLNNHIRFNEKRNVAHIRVFPQVDSTFVISTPHIISGVYEITFIKNELLSVWEIFAFGGHVDPYESL